MRIIADLPHPRYKITVFKNELKYSLKIESKVCESIFKIPEFNFIGSQKDVLTLLTERCLELFIEEFKNLEKAAARAYKLLDINALNDEIF